MTTKLIFGSSVNNVSYTDTENCYQKGKRYKIQMSGVEKTSLFHGPRADNLFPNHRLRATDQLGLRESIVGNAQNMRELNEKKFAGRLSLRNDVWDGGA
ncbi:hypothetical protein AVEN_157255-1 [Araneus ventricosus]|uniref:Uncharacterized protein n=1 Tax=Araneus ventricosus TaxID=182803 RepID=A0A4Y2VKA4_ARAVE|nr:hypothetical protein AVEN_10397-1 [Araneus ventricosus]GBO21140.1 hypothetical protein AVEN_129324-1 [Araneus ventricosus]GBO25743.1 hypothetical protein AVEN_32201-1 [Araneus ventricosus]GBO25755.1 hypothetical protein AVEN_157255-1 [Araneus ventricosus]